MKKLTLNKTWAECLRTWKWIAKEVKAGNTSYIWELKNEWIKKHNYNNVRANCFFCNYVTDSCISCPGKMVSPRFHCGHLSYGYENKPIAFYNKLVALNRKRLAKCKTSS